MEINKKLKVYKSLADPTRLKIVQFLAKQKCPGACGEISSHSELSQPALSHHFAKLVDAGVIEEQKSGTHKSYSLNRAFLNEIGIDVDKI